MTDQRRLKAALLVAAAIGVLVVVANVFAFSVDPSTRTVTTGAFRVQWSLSNPEEIVGLEWKGSPNLTNRAAFDCSGYGDLEYWGDSWGTGEGSDFVALVGWGTTGTWSSSTMNKVGIASSASGCFGTSGIPVQTSYRFWDKGAAANRILVQRKIAFGSTPFTYDFRPYIPRLYPRDSYSQVLHPNAAGSAVVTETSADCEHGCAVGDWNGSWFALHDPASGQGVIVRHAASAYPVALWVDQDADSFTTSSSVLVLQPAGGFTGNVAETEFLCFYDGSSWTPSLVLPAGC
jgi:hypothetical protein